MEDLQLNDNIILFNDRFRMKIDEIEKSINKNDKRYYEIYTNEISNNPDAHLKTLYRFLACRNLDIYENPRF